MDEKRKTAYRKILYNFLIQIKEPAVADDTAAAAIGRYAGPVAYALHGLALASANAFVAFDEAAFWQLLQSWDTRYPELKLQDFRRLFELDLVNEL